nr:FoF1 ATP synthase subunit gamma [uncultured Cohaesibacter sp.]
MAERFSELHARIETVHKLSAVIAAMRGIAASRAQQARQHSDSIRVFADTIGEAIGHALALRSDVPQTVTVSDTASVRTTIILIGAEQGFAGSFSERIFEAASDLLSLPHELLVVGDRGMLVAEERKQPVAWSAPMISHPAQATTLANQITEGLYEQLVSDLASKVVVVHAMPGNAEAGHIVRKQLVPFDYSRFSVPDHAIEPMVSLSPRDLLNGLVEEYIFSELVEAVMLSFAAENEARMRAMMAAHDNVKKSLNDLIAQSCRMRQEAITDEIIEISIGGQGQSANLTL